MLRTSGWFRPAHSRKCIRARRGAATVVAFNSVDFDLDRAEVFRFSCPNGGGKSSTMHMIICRYRGRKAKACNNASEKP
jgi:ABC-type multidrug transport system ATPase subunit